MLTDTKQDAIKHAMDSLALRIAESSLGGEVADPRFSQALMALSLWRMDNSGLAIIMDAEDEDGED